MSADKSQILAQLREINEYKFEEFIADLWEKFGWETEVTAGSQDKGVDVIAEKWYPVHQKHVIQAKRWGEGNAVGGPKIREYSSLRHQEEGVDAVTVVTTSSFTQQAEEASENLGVKLINGGSLYNIILEAEADELIRSYSDSIASTENHGNSGHTEPSSESSSEPINCYYCDDDFFSETAFEEHVKSDHDFNNSLRGEEQENVISTINNNDKYKNGVKCSYCEQVFVTDSALGQHLKSIHNIETAESGTQAECRYCSEFFRDEAAIREHLYKEHNRSELSRIDRKRVDQFINSSENE